MGVFTRDRSGEVITLPSVEEATPRFNDYRPQALPYRATRPMTGAGSVIDIKSREAVATTSRRRSRSQVPIWQSDSWDYFDAIGEIKFAFGVVANIMSRMRMYATHLTSEAKSSSTPPPPITVESYKKMSEREQKLAGAAIKALDYLDSAYGGQSGLLRDASLNLSVPGECFLVQVPADDLADPPRLESWDIRSVDEVVMSPSGVTFIRPYSQDNGGTTITSAEPNPTMGDIVLPKTAFVARIWRPHPRFSADPDSSMKGVLDLCAELLLLNRTARATAKSRLNAGAMYLPDGLSASSAASGIDPTEPLETGAPGDTGDLDTAGAVPAETSDEDEFEEALIDAMTQPIIDEDSASAVVPIIIRGPADLAEKIKIFKFERSFDPALAQRSDRVLERILQGIDVPKDIVTGLANVRYSNAFQIEQQLYKVTVEPLTLMLCDAFTVAYLRPMIRALVPDATPSELQKFAIWYDPSGVTTAPNREEDADRGYDRGILSARAWRQAHSFGEEDAPTPDETATRLIRDRATVTPELTEALLAAFAPDFMAKVREATQAANPAAEVDPRVAEALGLPAQTTPENPEAPGAEPPPPESSAPAPAPAPPGQLPEQINPQDLL